MYHSDPVLGTKSLSVRRVKDSGKTCSPSGRKSSELLLRNGSPGTKPWLLEGCIKSSRRQGG